MIHFEREVVRTDLIEAILKEIHIANVGMMDEDGYPYIVPMNFGFEINEEKLFIFVHMMKVGKKINLLKNHPQVCVAFNIFNDFPDKKYKGHYHDYRSVIAKGDMKLLEYKDDPEYWEKGYNLLYTCNGREIKPLSERNVIPNMYIGMITCNRKNVTAKSEFPLRSIEDVPFMDVYSKENDDTPFDLSDIIAERKGKKQGQ